MGTHFATICALPSYCVLFPYVKDAIESQESFPLPRPPLASIPYTIRRSTVGEGLGLFAMRDLDPGDLIVVERPLVVCPESMIVVAVEGEPPNPDQCMDRLIQEHMGRETREQFAALHNCRPWMGTRGIINTNAHSIGTLPGPHEGMGYLAIGRDIS